MITHARFEQLVATAVDFDLTPAEHTDLDNHLATCPACRALATAYRSDAYSLREIAFAEPPARVRSAVLAATVRPAVRTFEPWKLLAAAALLVGLIVGAALAGSLLLRRTTPLAGGPLIVYQVRQGYADIYTLDVISGERRSLGSVRLNAPVGGQRIQWTADGRSAFVIGAEPSLLQARVDLVSQAIDPLGLPIDAETDAVSPGGDRVARLGGDTESGQHLSIVDLSGRELSTVPLPVGGWVSSEIEWAPDGTSLLLSGCLPCDLDAKQSPTDRQHLFLVPLDGSPIRQLTDDPTGSFNDPRFSPDGLTIAYSTATCSDTCTGGIATVGIADGRVSQLTTSGPDLRPAWSPDGDRIAFERDGADAGIYVMDGDGGNPVRLTTASPGAGGDRVPFWSPNGAWIAFTRVTSETSLGDLWIVPGDGHGDERQLAQNAVADWGPTTTTLAALPTMPASALPISARPTTLAEASTSATATPASSPAASGDIPLGGGLLLIFKIDGTTRADAATMSVSLVDIGSGQTTRLGALPLTEATCCPETVQWSADRRRVFLSSELGLQAVVDLDAGTVAAAGHAPPGQFKTTVSRGGDRIARVDQVSGMADTIVISDLASKELGRLSVPNVGHIEELAWSPDDEALAVIAGREGVDDAVVTHLYIVPVDGSPARDLADNAAELAAAPARQPRERLDGGLGGAAWSPDGRTVAILDRTCVMNSGRRVVNGVEVRERYACTGRLLAVDAASGAQTVLLQDDRGLPGPPTWSPDGTRLAFGRFANSGERRDLPNCVPCERIGLFAIDRDGANLTRLADGDGPAAWSPDGTWVMFLRFDWDLNEETFRSEVWVVPSAGGQSRLIARPAAAGW